MKHNNSDSQLAAALNKPVVMQGLYTRSQTIALLENYSTFLYANGYMDSDWRDEPPYAIDEFMSIHSPTVGNSAAGQSGRVGCVHHTLKYIGPWYSCEDCGTHFNARAEAPPEGAFDF